VVQEDHDKTPRTTLLALEHPLVIDLIDERLPLLGTASGVVTGSPYLYGSGVVRNGDYTRLSNDDELLASGPFSRAIREFASVVPQQVLVVVHRAYWATRSAAGRVLENEAEAHRQNAWLQSAYTLLETALAGRCAVVEVGDRSRLADPGHKWGLAPYHYTTEYYDDLAHQVRDVLRDGAASRESVVSLASLKKVGD
jgi:hypothetical protein